MITLRDKSTSEQIGTITEEELQFLIDSFEEESTTDTDYYIDADTIEMLQGDGAPEPLVALLRRALGSRSEMDIEWARE